MNTKEKKELPITEKKGIEKDLAEPTRQGIAFVPDVDIVENFESITLYADLPGVNKENLNIDIREGVLTLTGTLDSPPSNHHLVYREYNIGGFSRQFSLGEQINREKISATLKDGVLSLVLPKVEDSKPRKIQITSK